MRRIALTLLSALAVALCEGSTAAAQSSGAVAAHWKVVPLITSTVTPNYQSGYGPSGGAGSGSTPAVGPSASLGNGFVDFGNLVAGYTYLYKYAAQVSVTTNDSGGFQVYAEGSTNFTGTGGSTQPASILFWMVTSSGNTPFSASTPFGTTSFPSANGGKNITYGASTPPSSAIVWSSSTGGTIARGFDYQMQVPSTIATDTFSAYVVYTVIGN